MFLRSFVILPVFIHSQQKKKRETFTFAVQSVGPLHHFFRVLVLAAAVAAAAPRPVYIPTYCLDNITPEIYYAVSRRVPHPPSLTPCFTLSLIAAPPTTTTSLTPNCNVFVVHLSLVFVSSCAFLALGHRSSV